MMTTTQILESIIATAVRIRDNADPTDLNTYFRDSLAKVENDLDDLAFTLFDLKE